MPPPGGKLTIYDDHRLLPADPNEWPAALKQDIRKCCCGDASTSPVPNVNNPTYPISCCGSSQPVNMSSVLLMNHGGSNTHNRGITLRKWTITNAPPPWLPSILFWNQYSNIYNVYNAWYSDLIEFMNSGWVTLTGVVDHGIDISTFTLRIKDTWYVRYMAYYNAAATGGFTSCAGTFSQLYRRQGTMTRVTFNRLTGATTTDVFDQIFPLVSGPNGVEWGYWGAPPGSGGQECAFSTGIGYGDCVSDIAQCNPLYAKGHLRQVSYPGQPGYGEFSSIFDRVPGYVFDPTLISGPYQWQNESYEPNSFCTYNPTTVVHAPYLEVMDAAGTPVNFPWVPPS